MRPLLAPHALASVPPLRPSSAGLSGFQTRKIPLDEASAPDVPVSKVSAPLPASGQPSSGARPSSDTATFSRNGQALLNQPEEQNKKVLSLLDQMFGITNVNSMSLQVDVSHAYLQQYSSREQQRSQASGLTYDYQDSSLEASSTALSASGTISLADGRSFQLDLQYEQTVIVTSERSLRLEGSDSDADLSGTGKQILDQLFSPEAIQQNLGDALRQLRQATEPESSTVPSLIATLEASALSTKALNAVFSKLRDQHQQQLADMYRPKTEPETQFTALAS